MTSLSLDRRCLLCGRDCSGRPWIADAGGRYACVACYEGATGARCTSPAPVATTSPRTPFDLPDHGPERELCPCDQCGNPIAVDDLVCPRCGFHHGLQQQLVTEQDDPDAASPPSTAAPAPTAKPTTARLDADPGVRPEYVTPLVMFVVAAGLIFLVHLARFGADAGAAYLVSYLSHLPVAVGIFGLCCLLWIRIDAPIHVTVLRLVAIHAVAHLALLVPFAGWILAPLVSVGLLVQMLEIDPVDALAVTAATLLARLALLFALMAA